MLALRINMHDVYHATLLLYIETSAVDFVLHTYTGHILYQNENILSSYERLCPGDLVHMIIKYNVLII